MSAAGKAGIDKHRSTAFSFDALSVPVVDGDIYHLFQIQTYEYQSSQRSGTPLLLVDASSYSLMIFDCACVPGSSSFEQK